MTEVDLKTELENLFCPVTGQRVLDPVQFNPSPAMVFLFLHSYRFFEYLHKDLKEKFSKEFKDEDKHGKLYLKLTEEVLKNEPNHLWFTSGGPPFGAVSMCFDMGYRNPEEV